MSLSSRLAWLWRARRPVTGVVLLAAGVAVGVLTLTDSVGVTAGGRRSTLTFGRPWGWLVQDQTSLDPPLPGTARPGSPWELPTSVDVAPLLVDLALVAAVLLLLGVAAAGWRRTRRGQGT